MILTLAVAFLFSYLLYWTVNLVYRRLTSPTRYVPGPKSSSLIYGNLKELWSAIPDPTYLISQWIRDFGHVMKYKLFFGGHFLVITDLKALNHILMNGADYQKPEPARWSLSRVVGHGLLVVEGDKHKQQRKIMNPAFGAAQIRELTEIFVDKSIQLRDLWQAQSQGERVRINVLSWLSRTTLDIIGLAGFNYKFDSLNPSQKPSELGEAFSTVFQASFEGRFLDILQSVFPIFRRLPPFTRRDIAIKKAQEIMEQIGRQLLNESRSSLLGSGEKGENWRARDLLSLLIRANMGSDLDESQRMTDFDVLSQIATFLVAGHETTSTATTWALFALSQDKRVQNKLREELLSVGTDYPTMDELSSLTYLDYVAREVLRLIPPVPSSVRVAVKDSVIPLNKPWTDTLGNVHDSIKVSKDQPIAIPIAALNRDQSLWGEDALEFKPERWSSIPEAASSIPGVWSNILTFLAGNRSCIGVKFAVIEFKALLFTLVRAFEFEPAVPAEEIGRNLGVVQRPFLRTDPSASGQLPLFIKPCATKE